MTTRVDMYCVLWLRPISPAASSIPAVTSFSLDSSWCLLSLLLDLPSLSWHSSQSSLDPFIRMTSLLKLFSGSSVRFCENPHLWVTHQAPSPTSPSHGPLSAPPMSPRPASSCTCQCVGPSKGARSLASWGFRTHGSFCPACSPLYCFVLHF